MKRAFVFPGQGSQFTGMGQSLFESNADAQALFHQANDILGFSLTDLMFGGSDEELKQTKVTQPAIFVHSVISAMTTDLPAPDAVAGHSLGEFSALVASGALSFEDGLKLVHQRAMAMQKACELVESTMAAVVGLEDAQVEEVCADINDIVVPANYNCPGQLVISGSIPGVESAVEKLNEAGARKTVILNVGGAFHSPLMQPAKDQLQQAIESTPFKAPNCPIYQNVDAKPHTDPEVIKANLIAQLTAPVRWTQTMQNMIADGLNYFVEVGGNGKVLRGLLRRVDRKMETEAIG